MTIRTVDSWMQLVDRLIICRLKQYHYEREQRHEEAAFAKQQGDELSEAAELYLSECLRGDREPRVHRHLRYHQHDTEEVHPSSVMNAVSMLADCHAEYWQHQGEVLRLRALTSSASTVGTPGYLPNLYEDIHCEQRILDNCNQRRGELLRKGDDLLRRMWEARRS